MGLVDIPWMVAALTLVSFPVFVVWWLAYCVREDRRIERDGQRRRREALEMLGKIDGRESVS